MTDLTQVPNQPPYLLGMLHLRGRTVPVISLAGWLKIPEPAAARDKAKIIVAEFNSVTVGFVVHQTTRIRRLPWERILVPPALLNEKYSGCITGTTEVEDGRILLILDLEQVLADLSLQREEGFEPPDGGKTRKNRDKTILVVDDSRVARTQVIQVLVKGGYRVETAGNGRAAWEHLEAAYRRAGEQGVPLRKLVHLVLTDIEMPEMDGYTLTRRIKEDERFRGLPVILHSSLSGKANIRKGKQAGCDEYVTKFDPDILFGTVERF